MEKQINSKLSFLDLNIQNTSGSFSSSVFLKATFTGLGLNFLSYCPIIYKINTIKTLLHRAYKLSSNYLNFTQEVEYLRNLFYNKFLYKIRQSPAELITVEIKQIFLSFPYFGPSSFELSKTLTVSIQSHRYLQIEFNFCFKNKFSIKSLFNYKDSLPDELCSNIIYKFSCGTCQGSYIGSTTKQSRIRFYQHLGMSPRTNRPVSCPTHSSPRNPCHNNNHPFSINQFQIIDTINNELDLRILESLYINQEKPNLNIDQSAYTLNLF